MGGGKCIRWGELYQVALAHLQMRTTIDKENCRVLLSLHSAHRREDSSMQLLSWMDTSKGALG